jgi:hypothetical protein
MLSVVLGTSASTPAQSGRPNTSTIADRDGRVLFTRAGGSYGDETVFLLDARRFERAPGRREAASCCIWALSEGSLLIRTTYEPPDGPITPTISAIDGSEARSIPVPDVLRFAGTEDY